MLIISTKKVTGFDKIVGRHLFKIRTGVYIGCITKRARDELIKKIKETCKKGSILIAWQSSTSHRGFELFEVLGDGSKLCADFDGILLSKF